MVLTYFLGLKRTVRWFFKS